MNNFNNMNYFMPNAGADFSYLNQMQNVNNWGQEKPIHNLGQNNMAKPNVNPLNNLNFNKCNYNNKTTPNELYDVYGGFIRGNMFPDLYNKYNANEPFKVEPLNDQAQLLTHIDAYGFAAHDLNLYLDTHPNDKEMIDLYNRYSNETKKLISEYEKNYGPLNVSGTENVPWSWNEDPWPWENN